MLLDKDIREPLFDFLEDEYGRIRILEEINIFKSRADVVMVSENEIYGIEIKSDADSYQRLKRQVRDYDKYFDYNYIVVGSTHAIHASEHVPKSWGIISVEEVNDRPDFYVIRKPDINSKMKLEHQLRILWRPEYAFVLEELGMPKYKNKSKYFIIDKIVERTMLAEKSKKYLSVGKVKEVMCKALFERDYTIYELAEILWS